MIWDCWWLNLCSENAGVGVHFIFGGCWVCKPQNMKVLYPN